MFIISVYFCTPHNFNQYTFQVEDNDELEVWSDNEVDSHDRDAVPVTLIEETSPCVRIV